MSEENLPVVCDGAISVVAGGDDDLLLAQIEEMSNVSDDPMVVYLSTLTSKASRRGMLSNLHRAARFLLGNVEARADQVPWRMLRFKHVQALYAKLVEHEINDQSKKTKNKKFTPSTIKATVAAVRGVMRQAYALEQISADDYLRITHVRAPKGRGKRNEAGRCLDEDEVNALFLACQDGTPSGVRDQAILAILFGTGFRREEVSILFVSDYDKEHREITVIVKGNKERTAHLPQGAVLAIEDWLDVRGREPGPLFCAVHRSGKVRLNDELSENRVVGQMSPQAVYKAVEKRCKMAGIKHCSPHDGRRTFTTNMIEQIKDVSMVQKILDHASVETTTKYDKRGVKEMKKAVDAYYVPYH
jgi:site-specific recombinase XerD